MNDKQWRRSFGWAGAFILGLTVTLVAGTSYGADSAPAAPNITAPISSATTPAIIPPAPPPNPHAEPVTEPDGYRMDDFRQPVPATLAGARVITTEEAEKLWKDRAAIFVDVFPKAPKPPNLPANTVWRDPSHMSIKGGYWLPNVGYGALAPDVEQYFRMHLEKLTAGDTGKAVIFYCLKDCWMSWNAAKRALSWGYTNVIWFPDGTDGWTEAGNDIVYLKSEP